MDRYTKTILTVIAIALISIAVKDVDLFPIAEAQQGWEIDNEIAMMDGSMQGLPEVNNYAYICRSRFNPLSNDTWGHHGFLTVTFHTAPQCKGSWIGYAYMFSEGATHSYSDSNYLLSENQVLYFSNSVDRAADTGQRVMYHRCYNKTNCLRYIDFRGDPADAAD